MHSYQGFEKEIADATNEEQKNDSLMRLSWALVHSRQPEDVNRGIGMLQGDISISY
jgi:fission 1 protein